MTWTSPKTWVVSDVLTASDMNTYVRDNTSDLNTRLTPLESGLAILGTGSGTATSIAMTEPTGERVFKVWLLVTGASGSHQVICTLNSINSGYTGQYWNIAADAVTAADSTDYGSTSSWALMPSKTIGSFFIELTVAYYGSGNASSMTSRYVDATSNTQHYMASGYNTATTAVIGSITLDWGVSSSYRYAIGALDF